jgi:hypothetical protein
MRIVVSWVLFGLGTILLVFAVLLTQVPATDRTPDEIVFSITGVLLVTSLLVGGIGQWRVRVIPTIVLGAELSLCLYGLASVLTYEHH